MSRYARYQDPNAVEKKTKKLHPIWRGIGFVMFVLLPVIAYAGAEVLIQQNTLKNFFPWPYDLMAKAGDFLYNGDPLLYIKMILTIVFILVLYAVFTLVTFIVNSAFGTSKYGPYDVPPINVRVRKKAR